MDRTKQRLRVFAGCEGASEQSYVRWIQARADESGLLLFLDAVDLGGGDPLVLAQKAVREAGRRQRYKLPYRHKFLLLDEDRKGEVRARDQQVAPLLARHGFDIVYQRWEHEALLLRHFPRCSSLRPPKGRSLTGLRKVWQSYDKPAAFVDLNERLDAGSLRRAVAVERQLRDLLRKLGFDLD